MPFKVIQRAWNKLRSFHVIKAMIEKYGIKAYGMTDSECYCLCPYCNDEMQYGRLSDGHFQCSGCEANYVASEFFWAATGLDPRTVILDINKVPT